VSNNFSYIFLIKTQVSPQSLFDRNESQHDLPQKKPTLQSFRYLYTANMSRRILLFLSFWVALLTPLVVAQHFTLYSEPDTNTAAYLNRFQNNRAGISYRLPNDTIPLHYDISLHTRIDVPDFNFNGIVVIRLRCITATRTITLHSKQQTIISVTLQNANNQVIPTDMPMQDPVTEFLEIRTTSQELQVGAEYTLRISYAAILRTDDEGFYRSSYLGDNGERV
jgi:Peptidase M1 N-terminal domain